MKKPEYGYQVAADGVNLEEHAGEQKYRAAGLSLREIDIKLADHGFVSTGAANG